MNRPDVVPGVSTTPSGGRTPERWYNVEAFAYPGAGFRGNAGRNILEGPGLALVDLSIVKTHPLAGGTSVQVRFEIFNLLNRANFAAPQNSGTGGVILFNDTSGQPVGNAARIFSTIGPARQLQLGIRWTF